MTVVVCPDGGACHHDCVPLSDCWRTLYAGPLSGVYPDDYWPAGHQLIARAVQFPHLADLPLSREHWCIRHDPPHRQRMALAGTMALDPDAWAAVFPPDAYEYR